MGNYLIDLMTWSYSRINTYLHCPYQFYLKYISQLDEAPMFFPEYGSLSHDILAKYYSGKLTPNDAVNEYLIRFPKEVVGPAPSSSIKSSYFNSGIDRMKALSPIKGKVLGIENKVSFSVYGFQFIGFVDMVYENNDSQLCILDHKSRALKPRSSRKKPTKTDFELDEYLRQLYLYSIPIIEKYGEAPSFLEFNCYRTGQWIKEPFKEYALDEAKDWAVTTIHSIREEKDWKPNLDFWKCKYLCGYYDQCEYAQMADF